MVCIVLAAGYATRMYPLTENFPKPLLDIKGKAILDYLIDDLSSNEKINKFVIVSNHKFINHFNDWKTKRKENIVILDDGSIDNDHRLGAVKDIEFAIKQENINDDIIVLAADNLLDFSLNAFIDYSYIKGSNAVMRYYEEDINKLKRTGVAVINEEEQIINMEEKPSLPKSNWAIPPFYIFKKEYLKEIELGISSGCKVDAPGGFIEWFVSRNKVFAYLMPGKRIDIGNLEQYYKLKNKESI